MGMRFVCGLSAFALLAACGGADEEIRKDESVVTVSSSGGATAIATATDGTVTATTIKQGVQRAPSKFLLFAPEYPGATVKTRVASADSEEGTGSMIAMETPDDIAKVVAFYDGKAKAAGIEPTMISNEADSAVRIMSDQASKTGALIAISRSKTGPGTVIVITSGKDQSAEDAAKVTAGSMGRLQ